MWCCAERLAEAKYRSLITTEVTEKKQTNTKISVPLPLGGPLERACPPNVM